MYRCNNCGTVFEETAITGEIIGEAWGRPIWENWACCPCCEDTDIEEVEDESDICITSDD